MKPTAAVPMDFPRVCAVLLAAGGTWWAVLVAMAMAVSLATAETATVALLYFAPGWLVYFGWLAIATGRRPLPVSRRLFWVLSAGVNAGYFLHEFAPRGWPPAGELGPRGGWWCLAVLLSLACAVVARGRGEERDAAENFR